MNKHIIYTLLCGLAVLPLASHGAVTITPNPFDIGDNVTSTGSPIGQGEGGGSIIDKSKKGCTVHLYNHVASVLSFSATCWGLNIPPSPFVEPVWFGRVWDASGGIHGAAIQTTKTPTQGPVQLDIQINTDPTGNLGAGFTGAIRYYGETSGIEPPVKPVCSLAGGTVLSHNPTWNDGLGDEVTINPSVKCTRATDINLTLTPNRIRMGQGGEIQSDLTIDGKPSILLKAVGPKGTSFAIKSTVHFPIGTSAGSYSGSSVLKVTIQ